MVEWKDINKELPEHGERVLVYGEDLRQDTSFCFEAVYEQSERFGIQTFYPPINTIGHTICKVKSEFVCTCYGKRPTHWARFNKPNVL